MTMRDKLDPALIRKLLIKVAKGRVEADPHLAYEVWRSAKKRPKASTLLFRP
ncbi:MAG: hypothetical protein ACO2PM_12775 [Pyrobaculum sp.]